MRRGTTPKNIFETDTDLTLAEAVFLTYQQKGETVLEKGIADMTITAEAITVELSQDDTLAFDENAQVQIQIRARFPDGSAVASNIMNAPVGRILKEGVI